MRLLINSRLSAVGSPITPPTRNVTHYRKRCAETRAHSLAVVRVSTRLERWGVLSVVLPIALALLIVTSVSAAAIISATKTDTFVGAHDGDGQADPGETIQYDVVINNTGTVPGTDDATGVTFNDTIDSNTTLVSGSINVSPLAGNDTYATIGNTLLEVGVPPSGNPAVQVTVSVVACSTTTPISSAIPSRSLPSKASTSWPPR